MNNPRKNSGLNVNFFLQAFAGYIKIARLDHWIKQLFILPGSIFAMFLVGVSFDWLVFVPGIASTCLIASANYIINEYLDRNFDQYHPVKKHRPVVAENLKPAFIWLEYILFTLIGFLLAWFTSIPVFILIVTLWLMGVLYNVPPMRLKEIPFVDVLSESINNALRLLIGWFLITDTWLPPVSIIIGYWMGGAFLMTAKRFAEYRMINDKNIAGLYRKSFKFYNEKKLLISAFFYAMLSVFFCGVFMIKYRIELLVSIPFLCGLFCMYFYISYKSDSSAQKPEKLFREKGLMIYIGLFVILLTILMIVPIPFLQFFLESSLIKLPQ